MIHQQAAYHQLTPNPGRPFGHMDFRTRIPELHAVMGSSKRPIQLKFAHLAQQQKTCYGLCHQRKLPGRSCSLRVAGWSPVMLTLDDLTPPSLALDIRELTRSTISAVQDPSSLPLPRAPPPVASGQAARQPSQSCNSYTPPSVCTGRTGRGPRNAGSQWQPVAQAHAQGAPPLGISLLLAKAPHHVSR